MSEKEKEVFQAQLAKEAEIRRRLQEVRICLQIYFKVPTLLSILSFSPGFLLPFFLLCGAVDLNIVYSFTGNKVGFQKLAFPTLMP